MRSAWFVNKTVSVFDSQDVYYYFKTLWNIRTNLLRKGSRASEEAA